MRKGPHGARYQCDRRIAPRHARSAHSCIDLQPGMPHLCALRGDGGDSVYLQLPITFRKNGDDGEGGYQSRTL